MDELELLKKDWQKKNIAFPKLSYNDIYKMILKKSSSIVKWIFIISILEFVFWAIISFALKDAESIKQFKEYNAENIMIPLMVIGYIILAYFFYMFFKNYRTISATDNAKVLMENILKTRKTVKQYVVFNLILMTISFIIAFAIRFNKDKEVLSTIEKASANGELFMFYAKAILISAVVLAIMIAIFLLFYYLVYGLLLKRLNKNYKELKRMEV